MVAQIDSTYVRVRPTKLVSRLISYLLFEGRPLTTRGQWINPILFALFSLEKRLPQLRQVDNPVFILGTGRSGTTILGIVLSMHRDVGFLNEPKALWHAIYPEEDLIGSYSREDAHYRLDETHVDGKVIRNAHRLFGTYLASVFSRRLVDKYPELIFRVPFVQKIFPDAKYIFLVRNGWDTCTSIRGWSKRLGQNTDEEQHDWWGVNRRKWNLLIRQVIPDHIDLAPHAEDMLEWSNYADMAAVEWIVTMRQGLKLLAQYPEYVLRVNYEDLCAKPRQQLQNITNFFGFREDEVFINYGESIMKPIVAKLPFNLNPVIENAFIETLQELGYET